MKATLTNHIQTPRKTRMVTNLVKGKRVSDALSTLRFTKRKSAEAVGKLIASAAANAKQEGKDVDALVIENITVDKGITLRRWMPRARGRATPLLRERSHITVTLAEKKAKAAKK